MGIVIYSSCPHPEKSNNNNQNGRSLMCLILYNLNMRNTAGEGRDGFNGAIKRMLNLLPKVIKRESVS
jgi:hypothetical protein